MTASNRRAATRRMSIRIGTLRVTLAVVLLAGGMYRAGASDDPAGGTSDGFERSTVDSADGQGNASQEIAGRSQRRESQRRELNNRVRVLQKGTSSRASRKAALTLLPLNKLSDSGQQRAVAVLRSASMFRELPLLECDVEPRVYNYFVRHPDVAVSVWRAMKISVFQMSETSSTAYDVDSSDGTTGHVDVLHQSDEECLVICSGLFKNPLIPKPIHATGLFHLQTKMKRREDGTSVATHQGRMFVAFPSQAVGTIAKVVSPISNLIIDRNFREVSLFLNMMSLAMQRQPGWIEQMSNKLDGVPAQRRVELLKLTAEMYVDARKRKLAAAGKQFDDIDIDSLLPPTAEPTAEDGKSITPRVASQPTPTAN